MVKILTDEVKERRQLRKEYIIQQEEYGCCRKNKFMA
jgi:hypothetical protein